MKNYINKRPLSRREKQKAKKLNCATLSWENFKQQKMFLKEETEIY